MEEEALTRAPDAVFPVGYVRRPGIAQDWKNPLSQAREAGEVLSQLQVGKLILDNLSQKSLFVLDLFFRPPQQSADNQDQGPGRQAGMKPFKIFRPVFRKERCQVHQI